MYVPIFGGRCNQKNIYHDGPRFWTRSRCKGWATSARRRSMVAIHADHEMNEKSCLKGITMQTKFIRNCGLSLGLLFTAGIGSAVVSQSPLLTKTINVRPNIALVMDTSGSMAWECVYAKHVQDAFVKDKVAAGSIPGLTTGCLSNRIQYAPVNNLLYYNPKTTYEPGFTAGVKNGNAALLGSTLTVYIPKSGVNVTAFATQATISASGNYDQVDVTSSTFKLNGSNKATNPFGAHAGSRTDCTTDPCTLAKEQQNYANWKAYHSSRIVAAKTGLSGAFVTQSDNFRLAYGTIYNSAPNTMTDFGLTSSNFYTWLDGRSASGGTPLRTALDNVGKYYKSTSNTGPWGTTPWTSNSEKSSDHLSCRRSYALLITDGFYNDPSPPTPGDVDSSNGALMTYKLDNSKTYKYKPGDKNDPRSIGKSDKTSGASGYSDTLADIALKYWLTDLRTDLDDNNGNGTQNDPAFWQNMTTYMVSFGAPGTMTDAQVADAKLGKLDWVKPTADTASAVDDMRHAAHNGGGDFLTVTDAQQFAQDLGNVIGSIAGQQLSQAGVAASAVTLTSGTKKFVPYYTSGSWWGNLQMLSLQANGNSGGILWQVVSTDVNGKPTGTTTLPTSSADVLSRKIYVWADSTSKAIDFTYANLTSSSAATPALKGTNTNLQVSNAVTSNQVDWLRGSRTNEIPNGTLRSRSAILGDIVNSQPVFIKNNTNPAYEKLPATTPGLSGYAAYMSNKASRTEGILMVGANDGMLHAFAEGYGANVGGRETFAYVPRSVLGKLEGLTQSGYAYNHTFTVDGRLAETDAYLTTPDLTTGIATLGWRNVVVGSTGAGAKSVFALNVTDPLNMNGKAVLWEINPDPAFPAMSGNTSTSFKQLGHLLTQPKSGITPSGDWVTVFGNGYDSLSGKASLFVVETGTGKLLKEITTDAATSNGLGGVTLVLNGYQQVIGAYAGDLKGRVWKFDLSGASVSTWKLDNGGTPLFTALDNGTTALPITAEPGVRVRTDFAGTYLVTVGTGKLIEATDPNATTPTQVTYALWDKNAFGSGVATSITDSDLESIKIVTAASGISAGAGSSLNNAGGITSFSGVAFSSPTVSKMDWTTKLGWKMKLDVSAGQRVIYPVSMINDIVKIDTVAPEPNTSNCVGSASNALSLYVDPLTAACLTNGTLDVNGDSVIDENDLALDASGNTIAVCAYSSLADGMDVVLKKLAPNGDDTGIVSVQNSSGSSDVNTSRKKDPVCSDPAYAAAHVAECGTCADPAYKAANPTLCKDCSDSTYFISNAAFCCSTPANRKLSLPNTCPGTVLQRSWRQIFPRAN